MIAYFIFRGEFISTGLKARHWHVFLSALFESNYNHTLWVSLCYYDWISATRPQETITWYKLNDFQWIFLTQLLFRHYHYILFLSVCHYEKNKFLKTNISGKYQTSGLELSLQKTGFEDVSNHKIITRLVLSHYSLLFSIFFCLWWKWCLSKGTFS